MTQDTNATGLLAALPEGYHVETNVELTRLHQHPKNPRRGNVEKIRESIRAHGFVDLVIAQESSGHIIVGNHRVQAAALEGYETAPIVVWTALDDIEAERLLLAHNRASDEGEYDREILRDVLREMEASTGGLAGTLYDDEDLLDLRRLTGELTQLGTDFLNDVSLPEGDDGEGSDARRAAMDASGRTQAFSVVLTFELDERDEFLELVAAAKDHFGVETTAAAALAGMHAWASSNGSKTGSTE